LKAQRRHWFRLFRLAVLGLAVLVLYQRLDFAAWSALSWPAFSAKNGLWLVLFLLLGAANLLLDALNWQRVAKMVHAISWRQALKENLKTYLLSFISPFQSGELVGRYLVLSRHRSKTIFLTFWTHAPKLFAKFSLSWPLFCWLFIPPSEAWLWALAGLFLCLGIFLRLQKLVALLGRLRWRGIQVEAYLLSDQPRAQRKIALWLINLLRFAAFSLQMGLALEWWSGDKLAGQDWALLPLFYFASAVIPSWAAFDFLVKGGLAVLILESLAQQETEILLAAATVWVFNVVMPAFAGMYFVGRRDWEQLRRSRILPGNRRGSARSAPVHR